MHTPIAPSRPSLSVPGLSLLASLCCIAFGLTAASAQAAEGKAAAEPIPFAQLGAKATADYKGDAIGITATAQGASLHTGFQKLSGTVTHEGLWLNSTDTDGGSLHLVASSLGREETKGHSSPAIRHLSLVIGHSLPPSGDVSVTDKLVTFSRPLVTEEYSVSVDGVRQDFVIAARPAGAGDLSLELALSGAKAEVASYGARLTLDGSGRALAYSRLRVVDAKGREFVASLHVLTASRLAVRVQDAGAAYPLRIDPTFSDANWVSLSMGMNGAVQALAVSGTNLYVGGSFTTVGVANTNCIAQWNGSAWSSLGTGISTGTIVNALALDGSGNLYAGGTFTAAGGVAASNIAQWNGSAWSALGSGVTANVYALLMNGTTLYVAGQFSRAGGVTVNEIAQWNGSTWAALGTGLNNTAIAMALSGTTLYVGGLFTTAGGVAVSNIAQWNISTSTWSALGTGLNAQVHALALSGTTLYAGGNFGTAGGVSASEIAQWNITTSAWSALGTGLNGDPWGLMVTGTTLYVGGNFTRAGGVTANHIAQWNITTSAWSALGSGVDTEVLALAIDSSGNLLLGGRFNTVGTTTVSPFITEAVLVGPYIAVQEPAGTTLMEASSIAFGNVTGNSSATLTFTISDPGPATLTSLAVSEDGANAGDFTVSALGSTTVTAGSSTTFTVTFTPGALGARSAAIHIASNVTGIRNPFDVALTGIGVCSTITVINPVSGP